MMEPFEELMTLAGIPITEAEEVTLPNENSLGKRIESRNNQSILKNFWNWFADSKIKDAQGRPLVLYHGTDYSFTQFEMTGEVDFPSAAFFTSKKTLAKTYGSNVMPVYLKMSNPFVINAEGKMFNDFYEQMAEGMHYAKDNGFDGIIIRNLRDDWGQNNKRGILADTYTVFDSGQIKSVENDGEFSLTSSNIYEGIEMEKFDGYLKSINDAEILNERLYPEIENETYKKILDYTSLTGRANAITKWVSELFLRGELNAQFWENGKETIKKYKSLLQAGKAKSINNYSSYDELERSVHETGSISNKERKREIGREVVNLGNVNGYNLYEIQSYAASKKYGANTRWCTTVKDDDYYYNNHCTKTLDGGFRKLIYAINSFVETNQKYALNILRVITYPFYNFNVVVYDQLDNIVGSYSCQNALNLCSYKNDSYDDKETVDKLVEWAIDKYDLHKEAGEKEVGQPIGEAVSYATSMSCNGFDNEQRIIHNVETPYIKFLMGEKELMRDQSDYVRLRVASIIKDMIPDLKTAYFTISGKEFYDILTDKLGSPKKASLLLHKYGLKGIRYAGRDDGEYAVIFNPEDLSGLKKFYG